MIDVPLLVNGRRVRVSADDAALLSDVLREDLGLFGTKVGCSAGDCGACTVLVGESVVCACLTPLGKVSGSPITTVEGLADDELGARLQASFLRHAAAQCGFCTPGMLIAAYALLRRSRRPDAAAVEAALGGVLCRCTGYRSIIAAVMDVDAELLAEEPPSAGKAVGAAVPRVDGPPKVSGAEAFGDDGVPAGALWVSIVRSPHHRAAFDVGDIEAFVADNDDVECVLLAGDVPGVNRYGVIPDVADQPMFAEREARYLGEAVAAVVANRPGRDLAESVPIRWTPLEPVLDPHRAVAPDAPLLHPDRPGNVLAQGVVRRGDVDQALAASAAVMHGVMATPFVEHAYIEPEAGWAEIVGDVVVVHASTQAAHMDQESTAALLGLPVERVRISPTAVGGGFGGKIDLTVEPYLALAAMLTGRTVRMAYDRRESMTSSTKRHPAQMSVEVGADAQGMLTAVRFAGVFDTGAYASWGPTVANRVPVHASGPYFVPAYSASAVAVHTNGPPSGAFRGFGVPQAAIVLESALDRLADELRIDRLELRIRNALVDGQSTVTGQELRGGVGIRDCLEALREPWADALSAGRSVARSDRHRRGVGVAAVWYGCGNTAMSNPSTVRVGLRRDGMIVLHQGAIDIGQGSNTVISQILADAMGVALDRVVLVGADTALTPNAGKTSASRQTYITGSAALLAGHSLRTKMLGLTGAVVDAELLLGDGELVSVHRGARKKIELGALPVDQHGYVVSAEETYDPPTTALDADGQGQPYAVYGFGAQMAELSVDTATGKVALHRITAVYDVGRAVNPKLVIGQLEGGIAQGIGFALMEEYVPGRTNNMHDYLIPTIGDVPEIRSILVESHDPIGPYGAKGVGEHPIIATAPAIVNAIRDACGITLTRLPATPDRLLSLIGALP